MGQLERGHPPLLNLPPPAAKMSELLYWEKTNPPSQNSHASAADRSQQFKRWHRFRSTTQRALRIIVTTICPVKAMKPHSKVTSSAKDVRDQSIFDEFSSVHA